MTKRAATLSALFLVACGAEASESGDLQMHVDATTVSGAYAEGDMVIDFAVVPTGAQTYEATFAADSFTYIGTFDANGVELDHELYIDDDEPLPQGPGRRQLGDYALKDSKKTPGLSFHLDDDGPALPSVPARRPIGRYGIATSPKNPPGLTFLDEDGPPLLPLDTSRIALGNFALNFGNVVDEGRNQPVPPSGDIVLPALRSLDAHFATLEMQH